MSDFDDGTIKRLTKAERRAILIQNERAAYACAGLYLPAGVPEGAVKRLVEAADHLADCMAELMGDLGRVGECVPGMNYPENDAVAKVRAALRELGVKR